MITRASLPNTYVPYENLSLCSNTFVGGGHLIVVGEVIPLLIGSGETPKIWLQAPADSTGKSYVPLVVASVAAHPTVTVTSDGSSLRIYTGGTQVLNITQQTTDRAVIDQLDLRPIGFNVFGNASSLQAGGMKFSQSTFSGGGTMLAFGG
jgi:hypothetical protein